MMNKLNTQKKAIESALPARGDTEKIALQAIILTENRYDQRYICNQTRNDPSLDQRWQALGRYPL